MLFANTLSLHQKAKINVGKALLPLSALSNY